jgi:hypothetical protein
MRMNVMHCSKKVDDSLRSRNTGSPPNMLYIATSPQRFISRCRGWSTKWAIFFGLYDAWFSEVSHAWYEKVIDSITEAQFWRFQKNFEKNLHGYGEIRFYCNLGRFHLFSKSLIRESCLADRIKITTHIWDIGEALHV